MTSSKSNSTTNQARIVAVLLLTGIISVANEFALLKSAIANPVVVPTSQNYNLSNAGNVVSQRQNNQTTIQVQTQNSRSGLPLAVVNAVTKDVSRLENIPETRLRIVNYSKETWRNGCLEVLKAGEMCTQALVPGYKVTVSDGSQKWIYHTNNNGRNLRLASGTNSGDSGSQLPESVKSRVIRDASQRLQQPISSFFIMQVQQKTWKDGCLELADANTVCSQVLVPGYRVIVGTKGQSLVYHTNKSGSVIKLNTKASEITDNGLPSQVKDTVLKAASEFIGSSRLNVTKAEQVTFTDSCLNLGRANESCLRANQRGWRVTVEGARQMTVYHTSIDGNQIRLNAAASDLRLPRNVRNGVLKEARNVSGLSGRRLRIVSFKPAKWEYGCEDFSFNNPCDRTDVSGWEVTVSGNEQTWVFFTDATGNQVKLSNQSNQNQPTSGLPQAVSSAILRDAAQWSGLSQQRIRIVKSERKIWDNPCYLTFNRICNKAFIRTPGWIVTVEANSQTWIYHANDNASIVVLDRTQSLTQRAAAVLKQDAAKRSRYTSSVEQIRVIEVEQLNERKDNVPLMKATLSDGRETWTYRFKQDGSDFELDATATLPKSIENAVLSDVRNRVEGRIAVSPSNIVQAEQVRWSNGCLGIVNQRRTRYCFSRLVDGYRVTVKVGSELFVYHTDSSSTAILNEAASKINGNQNTVLPVRIPRNELPSPLTRGVVFRQISSGGFAGQTYETVLFEDGRIMRYRIGDMNDSQRSVRQVSRQQVRDFQRLLQRQRDEFNNMSYPAPRGAADYITYTLTSRDGTVQFNDTSRDNISKDLMNVVEAWNQILRT